MGDSALDNAITSPTAGGDAPQSPSERGRGKREAAVHARKKVHNQIQLLKPTKGKGRGKSASIDHEEVLKLTEYYYNTNLN